MRPPKIVYASPRPSKSHYSGTGSVRHLNFFLKEVMLTFVTLHQKKKQKKRGSDLKNEGKNKGSEASE